MAGRGGSCAPTPDATGATGAGVSAGVVAEGVAAALDGAGSGAVAEGAGRVGASGTGLGSQPPRASAATDSSAAAPAACAGEPAP